MGTEPERGFAAYLGALRAEQRRALERLGKMIRGAAPGAEACVSYGLPAFRYEGRLLVGMGAREGHCALYLMSGDTVAAHRSLLSGYDTSKGTIRFSAERPPPAGLIRKLVKARIAENRRAGGRHGGTKRGQAKSSEAAVGRGAKGRGGATAG